nr:Chain P, PROTEIN TRANSPORT PROTEIN DSL1 [Saccharomyces cerevisiae]5FJZ_Q Chain Q, PROTEIN TRANSPORT PROTEIN DSL1 [Saccharomyces cerevisiae]5FJZ_R Chain R, PROTEIN TRANSPORT PROTEIN DSL1 [Saccharomyces cerevisiae]5FJZ_S Chain S, PROTEIN TRANSPORT PROTEIN DSL1 [Saccharomyces cerevisiae]
DDWNWEVED